MGTRVCLFIFSLLLWGGGVRANDPTNDSLPPAPLDAATLDQTIIALMRSNAVPGLGIAVIEDGVVVWHKSYGLKRAGTRDALNDSTVFEAASLSKPLFAYAVLKLWETGMLDIDAPLKDYMPMEYVSDEKLDQVTARMVLTHTSGFPNWRIAGAAKPVLSDPGEDFKYSGEAFNYLRLVVEFLTKEPFHVYMKKAVLDPLGMTHSSFVWEKNYDANFASGHTKNIVSNRKSKPLTGNAAGSLHTTAEDYTKFLIAMMKPDPKCDTCLTKATIAEMLRPQHKINDQITWGLGWGLQLTETDTTFWHWGHSYVFTSYVEASAQNKRGVVILTNSSAGLAICHRIVQTAIGGTHPSFGWIGYR